jgi:hypothetical protein
VKTGAISQTHLYPSAKISTILSPSLTLLTAAETAVLCHNSPPFKTYGMPHKTINLIGLVAFISSLPRINIQGRKPFFVSSKKNVM